MSLVSSVFLASLVPLAVGSGGVSDVSCIVSAVCLVCLASLVTLVVPVSLVYYDYDQVQVKAQPVRPINAILYRKILNQVNNYLTTI